MLTLSGVKRLRAHLTEKSKKGLRLGWSCLLLVDLTFCWSCEYLTLNSVSFNCELLTKYHTFSNKCLKSNHDQVLWLAGP